MTDTAGFLLILLSLLRVPTLPVVESSEESSTAEGLIRLIENVIGEDPRPWAKPISSVDVHSVQELLERGILTSHQALWFVKLEEEVE